MLGGKVGDIDAVSKTYLSNQEILKRKYTDGKVTLYRGVSNKEDDLSVGQSIDVKTYNISSWTTDKNIATKFVEGDFGKGIVVESNIPIKNIFMQDKRNNSNYPEEQEHIVMGDMIKSKISRVIK